MKTDIRAVLDTRAYVIIPVPDCQVIHAGRDEDPLCYVIRYLPPGVQVWWPGYAEPEPDEPEFDEPAPSPRVCGDYDGGDFSWVWTLLVVIVLGALVAALAAWKVLELAIWLLEVLNA